MNLTLSVLPYYEDAVAEQRKYGAHRLIGFLALTFLIFFGCDVEQALACLDTAKASYGRGNYSAAFQEYSVMARKGDAEA
jgi:hypothetical protein